ncbi:MAG TPA: apolipoprotein N-acyltransferase [Pyrinomonadaceae bacterium]
MPLPVRARVLKYLQRARVLSPTRAEALLALFSAALLILSFPDLNLWPLAWVGLVPLLLAVAQRQQPGISFVLGWITGSLFFYGSCYWLTYAMIRYGHIPAVISYLMLMPGALIVGLFPAACMGLLARMLRRWGLRALFVAPFLWAALEWARLGATGQLWNAIGYSHAYHPALIQTARWGGVYAVGFLVLSVNAAIAHLLLRKNMRALLTAVIMLGLVAGTTWWLAASTLAFTERLSVPDAVVIAVQPNVPMEPVESTAETQTLLQRHLSLSESGLKQWEQAGTNDDRADTSPRGNTNSLSGSQTEMEAKRLSAPRIVIWPESPMNFSYSRDSVFREWLAGFAAKNHASVIFNALEPAPFNGAYNSAVMVNEEGRAVSQYDKIRLLPFGEYVPLPRWLPGVNLVPTMVGDFTPGAQYTLMPMGDARAGVFICFESAFPSIARAFTRGGADVLVNITNDGYLGPTPVMHQHMANTIFRAVENNRPVLRVTNTGITAYINARGEVSDETHGFEPAVRVWTIQRAGPGQTFYTRHGDLFAGLCAFISILTIGLASLKSKTRGLRSA